MSKYQKIIKRIVDLFLSLFLIISLFWLIIVLILLSAIDTKSLGIFMQKRIGQYGKPFIIFKIKTIRDNQNKTISNYGAFLRKSKLDELPQLLNILLSQMSFVGPRPDISGFADKLEGEDRIILTVKPGLTGPASLYFKNEEFILSKQESPDQYNINEIWPLKIKLNKEYVENYSLIKDFFYLLKTVLP